MVLPQLRSVLSPPSPDSPTLVFPDTSLTVLRAIVTLLYEGSIITSHHIMAEVLATLKNLGMDPDKFTKVSFILIIFKSISLLLVQTFLTIFEPRNAQQETKKRKRKALKEEEVREEEEHKEKKMKGTITIRRRKARERSHSCQLCDFWCETVKAMSEHTESQHPGQTLLCPFPGCQKQLQSYMKLRTHQHGAKHFVTDHSKEKDSQEAEKSLKLNNNENDEAETETNGAEGGNSSEPGQEEEDSVSRIKLEGGLTGITEIKLSVDQLLDEIDLKPELDDEVKE